MKKFLALPLAALLLLALSLPGMAVGDQKNLTAPDQQTQIPVTGKYEEKTAETVYSVDIAWGSMAFTYAPSNQGTWNPDTLRYEGKSATGAWIPAYAAGEDGNELAANAIRFTNRSNAQVAFTVNFTPSEGYNDLQMRFLEDGTAPTLHSAESGTAPSYTLLVTMVGELDRSVTEAVPLGNIVVGVSP